MLIVLLSSRLAQKQQLALLLINFGLLSFLLELLVKEIQKLNQDQNRDGGYLQRVWNQAEDENVDQGPVDYALVVQQGYERGLGLLIRIKHGLLSQ